MGSQQQTAEEAGSKIRIMVFRKVSEAGCESQVKNKIFTFMIERESPIEDWGLSFAGGWLEGQWINVAKVNPGSPASNAGIKIGDSLVQVGDDLVLFMNLSQVNNLLLKEQLQISLTIERGNIAPLTTDEIDAEKMNNAPIPSADMVTIVIDKNKGIWARK